MNKRLLKIILSIILLFNLVFSSINTIYSDNNIYDEFTENVKEGSKYYSKIGDNYSFIDNEFVTIYGYYSIKNNKLSISLLIINNMADVNISLISSNKRDNYISQSYSTLYNYEYGFNNSLRLNIYLDDSEDSLIYSYDFINFKDINEFNNRIVYEGNDNNFPKSTLNKHLLGLSTILKYGVVIGSGVIVLLIITLIIILSIKSKKKKESINNYNEDIYYKNDFIRNNNVIDSTVDEEIKEDIKYDKDYLKSLFKKKMNHEISDIEFDKEVKKYFNNTGDSDEDKY